MSGIINITLYTPDPRATTTPELGNSLEPKLAKTYRGRVNSVGAGIPNRLNHHTLHPSLSQDTKVHSTSHCP